MENMQSFKTNDNATLKYFDSGAAEEGEDEKPWLILVSAMLACELCHFCFVLVLNLREYVMLFSVEMLFGV
jgi:hypothetical protein